MFDEVTSIYVEPMGQEGLQGLSGPRTSWNQKLSSLALQPLTQVALANSSSHLQAYNMPSYMLTNPQSILRKNDFFDVSDSDKQNIKLAFTLFDSRKVGRLSYRELKVIETMTMPYIISIII